MEKRYLNKLSDQASFFFFLILCVAESLSLIDIKHSCLIFILFLSFAFKFISNFLNQLSVERK